MIFDMEKTYKITLPKGVSVDGIETNVEDGVLSVSVEMVKERYMPKDGDFVTCCYKDYPRSWVIIYKKTEHDPYDCSYFYLMKNVGINTITFDDYCNAQETLRPATEEERQELLDALAKEGKRWNAEKKCIEDLPRWRAEAGGVYYVVNEHGDVSRTEEKYASYDKWLHDFGNYFRTREAAEKVVERIREIFKNSKTE